MRRGAFSSSMKAALNQCVIPLAALVLFFGPVAIPRSRAATITTSALSLVMNSESQAIALTNRLTATQWLASTSQLYILGGDAGLAANLTAQGLTNGEIQLVLTITNATSGTLNAAPTFPILQALNPGSIYGALSYCFPQMGQAPGPDVANLTRYYGGDFPLQFMDVYNASAGGIYLMTHDLSNYPRTYFLRKYSNNTVSNGVLYASQAIPPGGSWTLTAVLGAHTEDWHAALAAYQNWIGTWYTPLVPRQSWFQDVYNLREIFLYTNAAIGDTPAYNPSTQTYIFNSLLAQDAAAFGGVDFVHMFDWSQTPGSGRVGDYDPWAYLGGVAAFSNQVAQIHAGGSPVGLYFEGYLLDTNSLVAQSNGPAWQLLDSTNESYDNFGPGYDYVCPFVSAWTNYLTGRCMNAIQQSGATGVYLDEFGFGWQYPCYNSAHPHSVPSAQLQGEGAMMKQIRQALPASSVLYSEERGTDVGSQYQDGSFTYSISQSDTNQNPSRVNLARFALPDYKVFEIIRVDAALGNDPVSVESVFFNGEGIWLEGPLNDTWFPASVCQVIAKTHSLLRSYADTFRSLNPIPLVPTLNSNIYANEFPDCNRTVWTLYNGSSQTISGELLMVTNRSGATYYDAWNAQVLAPRLSSNFVYLTLSIPAYTVGCVVQQIETNAPGVLLNPQSQAVFLGQPFALTVQASGNPPLNYQWQFNGANLSGQTNNNLTFANAQPANGGSYQVVITNALGSVTSTVAAITMVNRAGVYSSLVLADGPDGYWRLDENASPGVVATNLGSLGAIANGSYSAGVSGNEPGAIPGDADTAISFDGISGKLEIPYNGLLNSTPFTIECWAYPATSSPANYMAVLNARVTSPTAGYTFYAPPNGAASQWQFWTGSGASWNVQSGPLVASNQWTYLVGTYDGTNQFFYVNGVLAASNAFTVVRNPSGLLRIGAGGSSTNTTYFFSGSIDEVAIYSHVLPVSSILSHYSVGLGLWMDIERTNGATFVNWIGGTLQQAGKPGGPWTNLSTAAPLDLGPSPPGTMFYRARH
jgi:Concanavalin A-like lectin/glucanases superfamily/Domain of unknown function (DUF6259)/Immunoglobulin domain